MTSAGDTFSRSAIERQDVVVIGAGVAGLTTAKHLAEVGVDVVVVEARDRVGGRTFNQAARGEESIEAGGMWVGPGQDAVLDLAKELGVGTFPTPTGGDLTIFRGGQRLVLPEGRSPETEAVIDRIDALAKTLPLGDPWDGPDAADLDAITLSEWLEQEKILEEVSVGVIGDVAIALGMSMKCDPSIALGDPLSMSMLWFLDVVHSADGVRRLGDIEGGAQERRFVGGSQRLSLLMAEQLADRVVLNSPVTKIDHDDEAGEIVVTAGDRKWRAERVVVAMMPADVERIEFNPDLPETRRSLQQRWKPAVGIKGHAVYERPFWREQGLSGMVMADGQPVTSVLEITPPDQQEGWLAIFVNGDGVPEGSDVRTAVLEELVTLFGDAAATPLEFYYYDWEADPWTSGCVTDLPPGVLTQVGRILREPVGRIHWAGTETSAIWIGYIDGAVRSGQRAATEVVASLA